jgi:hypothetical protein
MSAPTAFTPNLKGDARLDWKKFDNVIKTEACQILREITGGTGLLGYFLPAAQWFSLATSVRMAPLSLFLTSLPLSHNLQETQQMQLSRSGKKPRASELCSSIHLETHQLSCN